MSSSQSVSRILSILYGTFSLRPIPTNSQKYAIGKKKNSEKCDTAPLLFCLRGRNDYGKNRRRVHRDIRSM